MRKLATKPRPRSEVQANIVRLWSGPFATAHYAWANPYPHSGCDSTSWATGRTRHRGGPQSTGYCVRVRACCYVQTFSTSPTASEGVGCGDSPARRICAGLECAPRAAYLPSRATRPVHLVKQRLLLTEARNTRGYLAYCAVHHNPIFNLCARTRPTRRHQACPFYIAGAAIGQR